MEIAFICSPYRNSDPAVRQFNIAYAGMYAMKWWSKGYAVICPQKNTSNFDLHTEEDQRWLDGCYAFIERCDVVVATPRWYISKGCQAEIRYAREMGKHIVYADILTRI